jgi:hypothetical protein
MFVSMAETLPRTGFVVKCEAVELPQGKKNDCADEHAL